MNKNLTNKILPIAIAVVISGSIGFYGGMKYAQNNGSQQLSSNQQNARNFGGGNGQQAARRNNFQGGGFVGGEIISKDDKSITLKLRDGGSRIIFISSSTQIMKPIAGSVNDIVAGDQINVVGNSNSDGSINAESIQIRQK